MKIHAEAEPIVPFYYAEKVVWLYNGAELDPIYGAITVLTVIKRIK